MYWRPHYEQSLYPYLPPHVTKPKECLKIFSIILPEKSIFAVPRNLKLLAIPLFELQGNPKRYGNLIASVPQFISRFSINYLNPT